MKNSDLAIWEAVNLDAHDRYMGRNLSRWGFKYQWGDYIPIDCRYSAMAEWYQASISQFALKELRFKRERRLANG